MIDIEKLKTEVDADVLVDEATLTKFSRDASIFEARPQMVVQPKTQASVGKLVEFVSSLKGRGEDVSLTPSAGRTDMTGGSVTESIVVDFAKFLNRIGDVEENSIQVMPGAYYRDLEKKTLAKHLVMPAYPVSRMICGVGGMVGNNSGGEKSFNYGQVVDYVEELEVVLADGKTYTLRPWTESEVLEIIKKGGFLGTAVQKLWSLVHDNKETITKAKPTTSKNSAGYYLWRVWDGQKFNLAKLFVGSQGTLGIITDIKFKLVEVLPNSRTLVIFMKDLNNLGEVVNKVKEFHPESFELYDDHTLKLALKYLPEMLQKMGGASWKFLRQFLPELRMSLFGGLPKLVLLAEFTAKTDMLAEQKANEAREALAKVFDLPMRVTKNEAESKKYWTIRRESYNLLRQHTKNRVTACFIEDICVHPAELPVFLPELNQIFARYRGFIYTIAGHAGDANFHIMPLMDLTKEDDRRAVESLSEEVFRLVMKYNGTITAEHNDGIVRGPYLHMMFGADVMELFHEVKRIFDPLKIFNPHKKTDATMEYFEKHLRHS